jgi:hypothetical protein
MPHAVADLPDGDPTADRAPNDGTADRAPNDGTADRAPNDGTADRAPNDGTAHRACGTASRPRRHAAPDWGPVPHAAANQPHAAANIDRDPPANRLGSTLPNESRPPASSRLLPLSG